MNTHLLDYLDALPDEHLQMHQNAYPWFSAVRAVRAKKNKSLEDIQSAAVYVHDRKAFSHYIKSTNIAPEQQSVPEEAVTASKPIEEQEKEALPKESSQSPIETSSAEQVKATLTIEPEETSNQLAIPKSFNEWLKLYQSPGKTTANKPRSIVDDPKDELEELIQSNIPYEMVETKLDAETHYVKGLQEFIDEQKILKKQLHTPPQFDQETRLPITETFARLLIQQQKYRQAIGIYEKLSLKFPAKNAYFASLIQELQEKLK